MQRNTTTRDKHRRTIRRDKPDCGWEHCLHPGVPIDYNAHHLDPLSFTVDHITPIARGGTDTLDNKMAMHRACNRAKGDHGPDWRPGVTFVTGRNWWSRTPA